MNHVEACGRNDAPPQQKNFPSKLQTKREKASPLS